MQRSLQQRRRERFKNFFLAILAAHIFLFIVLLIQGCVNKSATTASSSEDALDLQASGPNQALVAEQTPSPVPQPITEATAQPAPSPTKEYASATTAQPRTPYVVKSGDTLSRIAKAHATTVKAIKSVNGLDNDRLVVGAKLKLPEA